MITEIDNIEICSKCGQPLLTETMLKQLNEDRIKRRKQLTDASRKWRQKKALEKKLSKEVKPLTKEELEGYGIAHDMPGDLYKCKKTEDLK
jgi:hypothetical protein